MTAPDMDALNAMSGPRLRALAARGSDAAQVQACFEDAQDYFVLTEGKLPAKDAAIHLLIEHTDWFAPMITHTRPLSQIAEAFRIAEHYADGVGKMIVAA